MRKKHHTQSVGVVGRPVRNGKALRGVKELNGRLRRQLVLVHELKDTAYAAAKYLCDAYDISEATARGWFAGPGHAIDLVTFAMIVKAEGLNANYLLWGGDEAEMRGMKTPTASVAETLWAHVHAIVSAHVGQMEERLALRVVDETPESFVRRWLPSASRLLQSVVYKHRVDITRRVTALDETVNGYPEGAIASVVFGARPRQSDASTLKRD